MLAFVCCRASVQRVTAALLVRTALGLSLLLVACAPQAPVAPREPSAAPGAVAAPTAAPAPPVAADKPADAKKAD